MGTKRRAATVHMIPQSHIDMAWEWDWKESLSVFRNTFGAVVAEMERTPSFRFTQNSAAAYEAVERHHPDLFEKIRERVRQGQWEISGGAWVEAYEAISSGESIVRQYFYGKRYFREKLGVDPRTAFNGEGIAMMPSLPQVLALAGFDRLVAGRQNSFSPRWLPLNRWKGADGSEIVTACLRHYWHPFHLDTCDPYTPQTADTVTAYAAEFEARTGQDQTMYVYGEGDHGATPNPADVRNIIALAKTRGPRRVRFSTFDEYFRSVSKKRGAMPLIVDMGGHRDAAASRSLGCSWARHKRSNARAEAGVRAAEILSVLCFVRGLPHNQETLDLLWKGILFNQFHDIAWGSCIAKVERDTERQYHGILAGIERETLRSMRRLQAAGVKLPRATASRKARHARFKITRLGGAAGIESIHDRRTRRSLFPGEGPAVRFDVYEDHGNAWQMGLTTIGNEACRLRTDRKNSRLVLDDFKEGYRLDRFYAGSILDRMEQERIRQYFPRKGFIREKYYLPLPADRSLTSASALRIRATERDEPECVDLHLSVDWHEQEKALFVSFPFSGEGARAHCGTPFHYEELPDTGVFRYVQGWIYMSTAGRGLILCNDGSYLCRWNGERISLFVIRAPRFVTSEFEKGRRESLFSDQGRHELRLRLLPAPAAFDAALASRRALDFANPVPGLETPVSFSGTPVILSALKVAADGSAVILRFYEPGGRAGRGRVITSFPLARVSRSTLLEERQARVPVTRDGFDFRIRPFEIQTYRLEARGCTRVRNPPSHHGPRRHAASGWKP